jgi:hypothetical protein
VTAFWSSVNGKLADKLAAISAPALVFWLGGLAAWSLGHGGGRALARAAGWLGRQSSFGAAAALVIVLAGVSASGLIVSRATLPALRLLEGYWPARPAWVAAYRKHRAAKVADQVDADLATWQELRLKRAPEAGDLAEIYRLEVALHRYPDPPGPFQPTRTGNLLRSAEGRPGAKYGLDAVTVWPQLWLVLPASTKDEITSARTALDNSVAATLWGILFCAFTPWTILALPAGLLVAVVAAVAWVPARAEVFGSMLEAAFDLHRAALYQQLRWPLPANPDDEYEQGLMVTQYLWRGLTGTAPEFTPLR